MGTGSFGALHARTLKGLPEAQLVALGNRTMAKAEQLARELDVPETFSSVEQLLQRNIAEALVISTSTETHVPIAEAALAGGIHVLVEKPVAANVSGVQALIKVCKKANRVAMAGHICMFHSLVSPLLERVRREKFRSAHFVRHRPGKLVQLFPDEHPITLTMVHDLYVAAQMVGGIDPTNFDALVECNSEGKPDHSWAWLRWSDGRVITFHSHWILPDGAPGDGFDWFEVFGKNYFTRVNTNPQSWIWTDEKVRSPVALEISMTNGHPTGMLAEELRAFLAACRGDGVPAGCRLEDALQVQLWMEQLLAVAQSKHPVQAHR
jgi:UDP-N-acetylglucosamine 3-dehydrogenase